MTARPTVLVVQHTAGSSPDRLVEWLAEDGIDPVVVAAPSLAAHLDTAPGGPADGLVLLGGGFMPDDDERHPFLVRERALVADALTAELPMLGICLGAQMLALVAGGVVTANSGETERGSCRVALLASADDDALFAELARHEELRMIENHRDSVTTLPPGAVHLATSDACRVQAFRCGPAAWGVQFHPEAAASRLAGWDEAGLAAEGIDRTALVAQAEADAAVNTAQARTLLGAFAGVVIAGRS